MVQVSSAFRQNIYATERTTKGRVSFEILDVEAYDDASIVVTTNSDISRPDQVINKVREASHTYATFEKDYFKLDGSSYIPPKPTEGDSELGWVNDQLSLADGTYLTPPYLEFLFTKPHSSLGLTLTFDVPKDEYPTDFIIETFDSANAVLTTETIVGNALSVFVYEKPLENYTRIRITFLKHKLARRRMRVVEVDFGIIREYKGDKLISLKVVEEMDLLASYVPSNEMTFTLDNSDNAFNILNPNGIYRFLKPNQEMSASIGLVIGEQTEFVSMGKYYLNEWTVEEGGMTSTFVGRDIFTKLDAETYTRLLQNTNLYDLAVDILTQANIDNYNIDESLKTITTVGFTEPIKVREALQMIAIASKSAIRQGRDGSVILEVYEELAFETGYITFAGIDVYAPTTPQTNIDYTFQAINFENSFEIPKLTLVNAVSLLSFKVHTATGITESKFLNPNVTEGIGFEINNPLINTHEHAQDIANWMFREYNGIAQYQANWRQNPALECGNIILVEDRFGSNRKARITKQEFTFEGYLGGVTEARGGI